MSALYEQSMIFSKTFQHLFDNKISLCRQIESMIFVFESNQTFFFFKVIPNCNVRFQEFTEYVCKYLYALFSNINNLIASNF